MIKADRDSFGFSNRSTKETGFFFHFTYNSIANHGRGSDGTRNNE